MPPLLRHPSLTRQLVLPVVGLVLTAVLANVGFSAWLAARRSAEATRAAQRQVADALAASRVTLSATVLDALHRLTGSHFLVWEESSRSLGLSTLPPEAVVALQGDGVAAAVRAGSGLFGGKRYRVGTVKSQGVRPETVLILTPERSLMAQTLEAVWPVLAVAAGTLAVLVPLGLRTTRRLATRVTSVERHVARIAEGEFGQTLAAGPAAPAVGDEIDRLVDGVNHMSVQLEQLRNSLVAGERQRLLGQLAAGFAHELRNAVTGARLAIDLHRRRCPATPAGGPPDDSLAVAGRQLDILEEEVRGLLALAKPPAESKQPPEPKPPPEPVQLDRLLAEVRDLTSPRCDHAGVRMTCDPPVGLSARGRHDALRAALVNLVLNGIDAAGRGGSVRLSAAAVGPDVILTVDDSGAGPPAGIRDTMQEPFVTSKPEGIGLGLAVARAVAEEHGGTLVWDRSDGRTRFAISLPAATLEESP